MPLEQEGEAVAAEDGERHAHHVAAGLGAHVGGNLLGRGVVALAAGHDGLRHGDDVLVARLDAVFTQGGQHRFRDAGDNIVTLAENGARTPLTTVPSVLFMLCNTPFRGDVLSNFLL